ncbi:MOSC domain-containing protein [Candidatus Dojkabacteria bacterium]|nr:MOSC domain-containing protein [Candidatus Dojkabacteria bacterium]
MGAELIGLVTGLFNTGEIESLQTVPVTELTVNLNGIVENKYAGQGRSSDVRDRELLEDKDFPKKILVRNWRQWTAVSEEELAKIATNLSVEKVGAELLGANIKLSGIPNFTSLPRGTFLRFPNEAILLVEEENKPCTGPGKEIQKVYGNVRPGDFYKHAMGLRGLVGVVQREGIIRIDDVVDVKVYVPKFYSLPSEK